MYYEEAGRSTATLIRDHKFLRKFHQSLATNEDVEYAGYPLVGEFWGEKNYLRYDIAPVVFNNLEEGQLEYSVGLTTPFDPEQLYQDKQHKLSYPLKTQFLNLRGVLSNRLVSQLLPNLSV